MQLSARTRTEAAPALDEHRPVLFKLESIAALNFTKTQDVVGIHISSPFGGACTFPY